MNKCPRENDLLNYISDELDTKDIDAIKKHINSCSKCTNYINLHNKILDSVKNKSIDFNHKLDAKILKKLNNNHFMIYKLLSSAAVVLLFIIISVYSFQTKRISNDRFDNLILQGIDYSEFYDYFDDLELYSYNNEADSVLIDENFFSIKEDLIFFEEDYDYLSDIYSIFDFEE